MDTATAPNTTNGASTGAITLDDGLEPTDTLENPATAAVETKADAVAETKAPTADELVLELSARSREAQGATKAAKAKQAELDGFIAKHKVLEGVMGLAKTAPIEFIIKLAEAAGLDIDTAIEAFAVHKSGGTPRTLTAEERVARLEAERENERKANETRDAEATKAREAAEGDAAIAKHVEALKSLAKAGESNFPLVNDDVESAATAAFDLMILVHSAGKDISYADALNQIESTMRADTEKKAAKLGFTKAAPITQNTAPAVNSPTTAQAPAQSRQTTAAAAPIASTVTIKSDDEIAEDWITVFNPRR